MLLAQYKKMGAGHAVCGKGIKKQIVLIVTQLKGTTAQSS
jgi:hypothetical protein